MKKAGKRNLRSTKRITTTAFGRKKNIEKWNIRAKRSIESLNASTLVREEEIRKPQKQKEPIRALILSKNCEADGITANKRTDEARDCLRSCILIDKGT
jgi:hypothetical protein